MSGRVPPRTAGARSGRDTDCAAQATRTPSGPPGRCSRVAAPIQWENEAARSPRRCRNAPISPGCRVTPRKRFLRRTAPSRRFSAKRGVISGTEGRAFESRRARREEPAKRAFSLYRIAWLSLRGPSPRRGLPAPGAGDRAMRAQRVELLALAVVGEAQLAGDRPVAVVARPDRSGRPTRHQARTAVGWRE